MKKDTLIFDLDGTLANTAPDLIGTLNRIVEPHDIEKMEIKEIGQIVGHGARAMIRKAFEHCGRELGSDMEEILFTEFITDYEANIADHTHLFEGVLDAMDTLEQAGFEFCVCTNKTERLAKRLLGELNVENYFAALTGGDTFSFKKPDGRHLEETVKMMGREVGSAIMIGDSITDIDAARNAGIPSIAVTFGYSDRPVEDLGATAVISHFNKLVASVREISNQI